MAESEDETVDKGEEQERQSEADAALEIVKGNDRAFELVFNFANLPTEERNIIGVSRLCLKIAELEAELERVRAGQ